MDWLAFVAKIVEFGAWPAVACVVLFKVWGQIDPLMLRLAKVRAAEIGGFKFSFEEGVRDVKDTLASPTGGAHVLKAEAGTYQLEGQEATLSAGRLTPKVTPTIRDRLVALADAAPRAAVLEAWLQLEHAAERLILAKGPSVTATGSSLGMVGPQVLYRHLERIDAVTPEQTESFQKLRKLRNQVVHSAEVHLPLDTVVEYIDLALALAAQFSDEAREG